MPRDYGQRSLQQCFGPLHCSTSSNVTIISNFHPFGCPVFVLESKLQSSIQGIPKWDPRSRLGIYLGHSPLHAGSVALVLNPSTGHVSPQYHVVFDDTFSTVSNLRSGTVPANWSKLVEESSYLSTDEDYDLTQVWLREVSPKAADESKMINGQANAGALDVASEGAVTVRCEGEVNTNVVASEGEVASQAASNSVSFDDPAFTQACEGDGNAAGPHLQPEYINLASAGLRRTSRTHNPTTKAAESYDSVTRSMHTFFTLFQFVGLTDFCSALREAHETTSLEESEYDHHPKS